MPERMTRVEEWIIDMDIIFNGPNGNDGLVQQHNEDQFRRKQEKQNDEQTAKKWTRICAIFALIPVLLRLWDFLLAHHIF